MTIEAIESFIMKYFYVFKVIFWVIIGSIFIRSWFNITKNEAAESALAWAIEDTLHFEGVITEYNGSGFKSSPTVFMISEKIYTVPRSNMNIRKGDTIIKKLKEHVYYLKRNSNFQDNNKPIDTIEFFK
jgi:hypothetical protein